MPLVVRVLAAVLLSVAATPSAPASAAAPAARGCSMQAVGSASGGADLGAAREWHLRQADVVTARVIATAPQTYVTPRITLFGATLDLPGLRDLNSAVFVEGPVRVGDFSRYVRAAGLSFTSDSCSISVLAAVDDQSPLLSVAGGLGTVVAAISFLALVMLALRPASPAGRGLGALFGMLAGAGLSLLFQQLLWLDPTSHATLLPAAVAAALGAAVPGILASSSWQRRPA